MEIKKSILISLGVLSRLGILSWCTKEEIKPENNEEIIANQSDNQDQILDNQTSEEKTISIWHGCIGCGKCAQISPSNFSMWGREAIVISQENADSDEVQMAVKRCPARMIEVS